jgi:phosphoribosylglycinamide formyltransferase-1
MNATPSTPLRPKILVLASGRGSNLRAILEATKSGKLRGEIAAVGVSKRDCGAVQIAEAANIPLLLEPKESEILTFVAREEISLVVLAGYMRILSKDFVEALREPSGLTKIANIHPSLLPAFPGMDSYRQAYDAGVRETGVTVHLVETEVDSGPILDQKSFRIDRLASAEEVEARGLAIEHELYANTLDWFLAGNYRIEFRGTDGPKSKRSIYVQRT